jgi:glutaminyl-peptide cyclotransferase
MAEVTKVKGRRQRAEGRRQKSDVKIYCFIVALFLSFCGCQQHPPDNLSVIVDTSVFNASNAMAEAAALAAIVPRHSGSTGAEKAANHLLSRLRSAGVRAEIDEFEDNTPAGRVIFRNVVGTIPAGGNDQDMLPWLMLGAHYDTKAGISEKFQGANDSGSGAGISLELARILTSASTNLTLKDFPPGADPSSADKDARQQSAAATCSRPTQLGRTNSGINIMFVFFDGEECMHSYDVNDGLHGSRRLAVQLQKDKRAAKTIAVIILDMVGDKDLKITIPRNSDGSLISALFRAAQAEGTREKFSLYPGEILDDHTPFMALGIPAIDVIDFEYGSAPGLNDYWHTPADTLDKLSTESIEIIGRTVLQLINDLK